MLHSQIRKYVVTFILGLVLYSCGRPPLFNEQKNLGHGHSYQSIKSNEFTADLYWNSNIKAYEYLTAQLEFRVNNILTSLPLGSEVYLWMPSMGHGGPDIQLTEISQGIYQLSEIYFIMEGDWQVIIKIPNKTQTMNFNYDI